MATCKQIIVLGGSYGGVSVAHYLLRHVLPKLPEPATYQVVLIGASTHVFCRPAAPRALISDDFFDQSKLFVEVSKVFAQYDAACFRFVHGQATRVQHTERLVTVKQASGVEETLDAHSLIIATGASTSSPLFGFSAGGLPALQSDWRQFREALKSAKTIVIGGGGPTGVEVAGELGDYLNGWNHCLKGKQKSPKVEITLLTSGPQILPLLRPSLARKAEKYLGRVGVTVRTGTKVKSAVPAEANASALTARHVITLEDGTQMQADLYIPAVGIKPNSGYLDSSLLAADGRVDMNGSTLRVDKAGPRVYAIGDVGNYSRPAVHLLLGAIPILCTNIRRDLLLAAGKTESEAGADRLFTEDQSESQLVPIGRKKGVGAFSGFSMPSWVVWAMKGRDYWLWTTGNLWNGVQWAKEIK